MESSRTNDWTTFIDQFGTHFAYEVIMGGRATQEISYSYESVSKLSSVGVDIDIAAKASYASFFADASFDWHKYKTQIDYSSKMSQSRKEIYIGGQPPRSGNIHDWINNVANSPMPIRYKLHDLSDLFRFIKTSDFNATKAVQQFQAGTDAYCKKMNCRNPIPDKPKPQGASLETHFTDGVGHLHNGNEFNYMVKSTTIDVARIIVKHGSVINNIQLFLSDGVREEYTKEYGGQSGTQTNWTVPNGERISQVQIWYDNQVNGLLFSTNKGGHQSPLFGRKAGTYYLMNIPDWARIMGLFGRSWDRIGQIGFVLGKTNIPPRNALEGQQEEQIELVNMNLSEQ